MDSPTPSRAERRTSRSFRTPSSTSRATTRVHVGDEAEFALGRVEPPGSFKWTRINIAEQDRAVADIGRAILEGRLPSALEWYRFNSLNERLKERNDIQVKHCERVDTKLRSY